MNSLSDFKYWPVNVCSVTGSEVLNEEKGHGDSVEPDRAVEYFSANYRMTPPEEFGEAWCECSACNLLRVKLELK